MTDTIKTQMNNGDGKNAATVVWVGQWVKP